MHQTETERSPAFRLGRIPTTFVELTTISNWLEGKTLEELAWALQRPYPSVRQRDKGYIGKLLEYAYGCGGQTAASQDLPGLQTELKSIRIQQNHIPVESTFVCHLSMTGERSLRWQDSLVYQKLQRVLWIPIEVTRLKAPHQWKIHLPFLWSPSPIQACLLQQDWEEAMERILLEGTEGSALYGEALQLRPKALHGKISCKGIDPFGNSATIQPKAFYLRASFTRTILHARRSNSVTR
eukprot:Blabericola_migrator_1__8262@NODE_4285_length_1241_cov_6_977002_g2647_i0_p1_GENE_NODE_4285_length_1241_cov_6_977002_g2647_i0NODE_4285_length_1241_cov_6_977002_g2647_i0_p1_ORF_typecomplete_len239_score3_22MutH/PF02976_15/1_3e14_NODE_4285_length_1241_cov_6_977002_g2647_i04481164